MQYQMNRDKIQIYVHVGVYNTYNVLYKNDLHHLHSMAVMEIYLQNSPTYIHFIPSRLSVTSSEYFPVLDSSLRYFTIA